jgi:pyridoxal phosphate enzyme (YggS family)
MPDLAVQIAENLSVVRGRIAAAAARSGRSGDDVLLVAVTKYVGPEAIRALVHAGCDVLGESRPQQLWQRAADLADLPIHWHMVGHLQTNKVRRTAGLVEMVHSVDSDRLLAALDQFARDAGSRIRALLEVHVSGEATKSGFDPQTLQAVVSQLSQYPNVEVRGLMCMASLEGGLEAARRDFAALRRLRDQLRGVCPAGVALDDLSMGMSGDYEVAIEEGATIVRIGSALFEGIAP